MFLAAYVISAGGTGNLGNKEAEPLPTEAAAKIKVKLKHVLLAVILLLMLSQFD
jgi:hypothetical protein